MPNLRKVYFRCSKSINRKLDQKYLFYINKHQQYIHHTALAEAFRTLKERITVQMDPFIKEDQRSNFEHSLSDLIEESAKGLT